ncbi:MAG: hypothetical protein OWT28_12380 [Firmicutes bacterium]|nr:hypothetical protein [Bacillota bacterium]
MAARFATARFRSPAQSPGSTSMRIPVFFAALFVTGVFCGAVSIVWFPSSLAEMVARGFDQAVPLLQNTASAVTSARTELAFACVLLLIVWLASQLPLLPIGGLLLTGVCFVRGASVGLCISELFVQFGWRGAGFDLLALVPWNILTGGGLVLACSVGYAHARRLRRLSLRQVEARWWFTFHGAFLFALALSIAAMWVEGTLSPPVARLLALG